MRNVITRKHNTPKNTARVPNRPDVPTTHKKTTFRIFLFGTKNKTGQPASCARQSTALDRQARFSTTRGLLAPVAWPTHYHRITLQHSPKPPLLCGVGSPPASRGRSLLAVIIGVRVASRRVASRHARHPKSQSEPSHAKPAHRHKNTRNIEITSTPSANERARKQTANNEPTKYTQIKSNHYFQ